MVFLIYFLLPLTGVFVGLLSTIFGVGGGIIAVPILYLLFPKISPQLVISSSMGMILINSLINTRNFIKKGKKLALPNLFIFGTGMALGVSIGVYLVNLLNPDLIKMILGIVVLLVAIKMIFGNTQQDTLRNDWKPSTNLNERLKYFISCLVSGLIAGSTGLGGGAILVPIFITALLIPYNWVSFLSNICMGSGAIVGLLLFLSTKTTGPSPLPKVFSSLQFNSVNFGLIILLSSGSILSSRAGVKISEKLDPKLAKRLFATLLLIVSFKILKDYVIF